MPSPCRGAIVPERGRVARDRHNGDMLDVLLLDLMGTVIYDPYREALGAAIGLDIASAAPLRDPQCWPDFEMGLIDEDEFVRRFFVSDNGHRFDMDAFH